MPTEDEIRKAYAELVAGQYPDDLARRLHRDLIDEEERVTAAAARIQKYLDDWYPHRSTAVVALYETLAILKDV